jgi:alcohol dehydrogenase class IV
MAGDCFLVMGSSGPRQAALAERVTASIQGRSVLFKDVEPNPWTSTVDRGAEALRSSGCSFAIALGGGSVIDAAKAMCIVASQGGRIMDYLKGARTPAGLGYPLIAVPTTPGTSSEITPFSVISSEEDRNKLGLRHPSMYPTLALIDPALTVSLPPQQTASTGLDIMSHAFESYWSAKASPLTREHALSAIRLLSKHLEAACADGTSREAREGVSLASVHAGLGFSNTGTTICHAISYPITYDSNLPHGMACALSLPGTFELIAERRRDISMPIARAFGCVAEEMSERLRGLMGRIGCPTDLAGAGYNGSFDRIADSVSSLFISNMPMPLSRSDLTRIFRSMGGVVS